MASPLSIGDRDRDWLRFVIDRPREVVFLAFLITIFLVLRLPDLYFQTSIYDMAIQDLPETAVYEKFKKDFGSDEIIFVVLRGRDIFDEETYRTVESLSGKFTEIRGVRKVISIPGIRKDMDVSGKWSLSDFTRAIRPVDLFYRNLVSLDHRTTVLSLILEDILMKDHVIDAVQGIIEKERGFSVYQIGMPVVSRALAQYTERDFLTLPAVTFLLIVAVLFLLSGNLRGVFLPAGSVLLSLLWTFGLMAWTKTPLSMMTMIVPIFITAVGTAYCMYVLPEYGRAALKAASPGEAALMCFSRIRFPTLLAVSTTTIGLLSLLLNRIEAIRQFALFSCFGIWSILAIIIFLQPAVLSLLPLPHRALGSLAPGGRFWDIVLGWIIHLNLHRRKVTLPIIVLLALFCGIGIFRIRVETNPVGYFKDDTEVSRHFRDISRDMAGSFPVNLVLDGEREGYFEDLANLAVLPRLQRFLESLEGVDKTVSFADYLMLVNYASNGYRRTAYTLPDQPFQVRMLMNNFKTMLGDQMFERFMTRDLARANILMRTHISSSRGFLDIEKAVQERFSGEFGKELRFQVTGFGPVISRSSEILTRGQVKSLSLTFVLIFSIMLLLFLSARVGFVAMLPNCFPVIVGFGLMGWAGIELSVVTSLVATIAIGLVVDDTIHYMVRYNREFKKDLNKEEALRNCIEAVGRPILFTTITIGIGFSVLIFSHFRPTSVFGVVMVVTVSSALIGDLIILPSLLDRVELVTLWDLLRLKLGGDPREGIPLFEGMSPRQVHYVLMAASIKSYERGDLIFEKGETSESMYAIVSGELQVLNLLEGAHRDSHRIRTVIANLKRGDIVGEMGMARACSRSATVVARTPAELLQINEKMIRRLQWLYPPTAQKFFFNLIGIVSDRLQETTQALFRAAALDSLTGIPTPRHFMDGLEKEVERARRYRTDVSVFILEIDDFKSINRTYGYEKGDFVLAEVGRLILSRLRKSDLACRYGGYQFAVMLTNCPAKEAMTVCARFKEVLMKHPFGDVHSPLFLAVNIGFSSSKESSPKSARELLEQAFQALGKAGESGKGGVMPYG